MARPKSHHLALSGQRSTSPFSCPLRGDRIWCLGILGMGLCPLPPTSGSLWPGLRTSRETAGLRLPAWTWQFWSINSGAHHTSWSSPRVPVTMMSSSLTGADARSWQQLEVTTNPIISPPWSPGSQCRCDRKDGDRQCPAHETPTNPPYTNSRLPHHWGIRTNIGLLLSTQATQRDITDVTVNHWNATA